MPNVSKWTSKMVASHHHALATVATRAIRATCWRRSPTRSAQMRPIHSSATSSVATTATSCIHSSTIGWGHTDPRRPIGHIASSKWFCQKG